MKRRYSLRRSDNYPARFQHTQATSLSSGSFSITTGFQTTSAIIASANVFTATDVNKAVLFTKENVFSEDGALSYSLVPQEPVLIISASLDFSRGTYLRQYDISANVNGSAISIVSGSETTDQNILSTSAFLLSQGDTFDVFADLAESTKSSSSHSSSSVSSGLSSQSSLSSLSSLSSASSSVSSVSSISSSGKSSSSQSSSSMVSSQSSQSSLSSASSLSSLSTVALPSSLSSSSTYSSFSTSSSGSSVSSSRSSSSLNSSLSSTSSVRSSSSSSSKSSSSSNSPSSSSSLSSSSEGLPRVSVKIYYMPLSVIETGEISIEQLTELQCSISSYTDTGFVVSYTDAPTPSIIKVNIFAI